ncbi:hypothetical protein [Carnobacterium maltaromaticum]|uniref:hypothetical protein n=2 Tax=Carnobacterium maltaromaticum TaxID=2751 RepID=UPI0005A1F915|nr:hypothetical protein [Carnobacterium maltaromaticum]
MKLTVHRVKQYNSTYKHVISLNGQPICISKSGKRASDIIAYLQGYDIVINDGKLQKQLNKIKAKMHKRR